MAEERNRIIILTVILEMLVIMIQPLQAEMQTPAVVAVVAVVNKQVVLVVLVL